MKINHTLLLCLTVVVLFVSSSCSDDDRPGGGNLVVGDKKKIMRSSILGFSSAPHQDAQGNTYYIHHLNFMDYQLRSPYPVIWATYVYFDVTSSSPISLPDGDYVTPTDGSDIHAGQIYGGSFSIDGRNGELPHEYSGFSYKLLSGTATLSVHEQVCKITFSGTVYGDSEKTANQTAEATLLYDGTWEEMYVAD